MPRLDDPNTKLKEIKIFKRQSLRPWDDLDSFKPNAPDNVQLISTTTEKRISKQLVNNKGTISKQLVNNKGTIREQEKLNKETISKPISKQEPHPISKQLVNQLVNTKPHYIQILELIKNLVGFQRKALFYIVEDCKERGLLYTSQITNEILRILLNTSADVVKTTIQRLIKKGLIAIEKGKRGKGGYKVFTISEIVRNASIAAHAQLGISKQLVNQLVNDNSKQLVNNKETIKGTSGSSSSSYINTTTEVNVHTAREELPEPWQAVDCSVLAHIDFNVDHLFQLCQRGTLEPEVVQDSLYHFAFDLQHNKKREAIKGDPLNYLMGVLAKRPYTAPANYVNPNVEAFKRYAEEKARQDEQLQALEANVQNSEFQSWYEHLPQEELDALCSAMGEQSALPDALQKTIRMRHLRKHFNDFVWPEVRRRLRSMQTS